MEEIENILENELVEGSSSCRKGKGKDYALKLLKKYITDTVIILGVKKELIRELTYIIEKLKETITFDTNEIRFYEREKDKNIL